MDRHEIAARNTETIERRWNLVKGQRYIVSLSTSGYIAQYCGFGLFRTADGRDYFPMPAHITSIDPYTP